jgi:excisionase family DNA binding protein
MVLKLITSEEAARILGLSLDELNHLREQREISGYRDGSSWKFKEQDIQQLKERRSQVDPEGDSSGFDDLSFSIDADDPIGSAEFDFGAPAAPQAAKQDSQELIDLPIDDDHVTDEVVLLSDLELGESGPGTSSTIIGRPGVQSPEESDIRIVTDEDSGEVSAITSDLALPSDSGSSLALVVDDQFDVSPEADTQLRIHPQAPSSSGLDLTSDSALRGKNRAAGSDIALGDENLDMDDLVLGSDPGGSKGSKAGESGIALAVEDLDDDELVLGGGSDITLGSADSGISLASPSDSGLSLEEPLALRPIKEAPIASDEISLDDESDASSADDFLLTPMQDVDDQDSGSQVIALDSESSIGADMFGEDAGMGGDMFEEAGEAGILEGDFGAVTADPLAGAAAGAALSAGPVSVSREAPYTVWNVVSLSACALVLAMCGLMMFDLVRNMWSWDSPYSLNSWLADTILGIIPGMQ